MRYVLISLICLGAFSACSKSHTSRSATPAPAPNSGADNRGTGAAGPDATTLDLAVQHILEKHLTGAPIAVGDEYLAAALTVHADGTYEAQIARGFSASVDPAQGTSLKSTWKADGIHLTFDGLGTGAAGMENNNPGVSLTVTDAGLGLGERTFLLNDAPSPATTPDSRSAPASTPPPSDAAPSAAISQNPTTLEGHNLVFAKDLVATADQLTSDTVTSDTMLSVDLEGGGIKTKNSPIGAATVRCTITLFSLDAAADGPTTLLVANKSYPVIGTTVQTGTTFVVMKGADTTDGTFILDCTVGAPGLGPQRTVTTDDIKTALGSYASFQ